MKFIDFEFGVDENFNDVFNAKVFSFNSKQSHNVSIQLDEEENLKGFSCTCKGTTIYQSRGKSVRCRHVNRLEEVIKLMGYLK